MYKIVTDRRDWVWTQHGDLLILFVVNRMEILLPPIYFLLLQLKGAEK